MGAPKHKGVTQYGGLSVFRSLKPFKLLNTNSILLSLHYLTVPQFSHFCTLVLCFLRPLYVGQPCHPTDNLRSVVYLVDTSSMVQGGWLPTLLTSFHLLLQVKPAFSPSLFRCAPRDETTDTTFSIPFLPPLFISYSQATPCILGRKRRITTITRNRRMSTRSRIVVNTMDIKLPPLVVTALACGCTLAPNRREIFDTFFFLS